MWRVTHAKAVVRENGCEWDSAFFRGGRRVPNELCLRSSVSLLKKESAMQDIQDWLRSEVADVVSQGQNADARSDIQASAQRILRDGISAGYTGAEISAACGGDIETYLLNETNGDLRHRIQHGMERDKYSG
jgi:thymidine phosphorylase